MEELLDQYLVYLQKQNRSINTIKSYERDLKKFFRFLSEKDITDIRKVHHTTVLSYIIILQKRKCSSSSISRYIVSLRKFFDYSLKNRILNENPVEKVNSPKTVKKNPGSTFIGRSESIDAASRLRYEKRTEGQSHVGDPLCYRNPRQRTYRTGYRGCGLRI